MGVLQLAHADRVVALSVALGVQWVEHLVSEWKIIAYAQIYIIYKGWIAFNCWVRNIKSKKAAQIDPQVRTTFTMGKDQITEVGNCVRSQEGGGH